MALPLWALLAASLAVSAEPGPCPYSVGLRKVDGKWKVLDAAPPLPPDQCALVQSLEEPLSRIVAAASLPPGSYRLAHKLTDDKGFLNAFFDEHGIFLSDGFASCLVGDRTAAIEILCHEMGHAVQKHGADDSAHGVMADLYRPGAPALTSTPERAALSRDVERHADLIGRELCTRAGLSMRFEQVAQALKRCNPGQHFSSLRDHPTDDERLATALEDKPRLSDERAHEIGAAIQRRARRLLAGQQTIEDVLSYDPNSTPREWALKPAADKDRLRGQYVPSVSLAQLRATSPDRLTPPPAPAPAARAVPVSSSDSWLDVLKDWLTGGR